MGLTRTENRTVTYLRGGKIGDCLGWPSRLARKLVTVPHPRTPAPQIGDCPAPQYRRLAGRRGKKRAVIAVGHSQLVSAYHMLRQNVDYHDLGAAHFDTIERDRNAKHLLKRLEAMGYHVTVADAA